MYIASDHHIYFIILSHYGHFACQTLFKCGFLIVMVVAMGYVANQVQQSPDSSWEDVGAPFLLGLHTLATLLLSPHATSQARLPWAGRL